MSVKMAAPSLSKSSRARRHRTRTPSVEEKVKLSKMENPLVQLSFEGSRHHIPERLPSARRERMVGIRVIDFSETTKENIIRAATTLKRLDLSNLNLPQLPNEFADQLLYLERLDLSYNDLTEEGFPSSLRNMELLIELCACHNSIAELPKCIRRLKQLQRLKFTHNQLKNVDGLEKLKKLVILLLDGNQIEFFNRDFYVNLKKLEVLNCSQNSLRELSADVRHLRNLREVDVSNNELTYLPAELFLLPKLDSLVASNNSIARLPTIVVKGKSKTQLTSIDLSGNVLVKFPDHLLHLTHSLDLSRNRIKSIPGKTLKKMDWNTTQELHLEANPLINPPAEICQCGIRSIIQYFQEAKTDMKVYQGAKILVVGQYRAGKTSMIQTLVDLQGRLMDEEDRTAGIDVYETSIDLDGEGALARQLQLCIWDFAGDRHFLFSHYFFLQQPSLTVLAFNMAEYKPEEFHSMIGTWIDWITAKTNRLVLLVVGTHEDLLPKRKAQEVCADVKAKIDAHIKHHVESIQQEIKTIESKSHISPALSEQLKAYISLLKIKTNCYPRVIPFSSASMSGLPELNNAIIQMCTNTAIFPNVMRPIPSLWAEVESYVDDKGYRSSVPLIGWDEYVTDITKRFGMKHLIEQITQYLHETGKVLWYWDHPTLREYVILRPTWLMDLMKNLLRRDLCEQDAAGQEEMLKHLSISPARYDLILAEYRQEGIVGRDLLRMVWQSLFPTDVNKQLMQVVRFLIEFFEIGYICEKPYPDGRLVVLSRIQADRKEADELEAMKREETEKLAADPAADFQPNKNGAGLELIEKRPPSAHRRPESVVSSSSSLGHALVPNRFQRILIPCMRNTKQPKAFREEYEEFVTKPTLVANVRFPKHIPTGLFETLCTRAATRHNLDTLFHWNGGFYARHTTEPMCRFYLLRINHDSDKSTCVRTELRSEISNDVGEVENMWTVLLPFLKDFDSLISRFTGARVERNMECPMCHSLSFLGEWQTPKDLQAILSRQCHACNEDIDVNFLIQPKEKKKVTEMLRQMLAQNQQKEEEKEEEEKRRKEMEELDEEEAAEAEDEDAFKPSSSQLPVEEFLRQRLMEGRKDKLDEELTAFIIANTTAIKRGHRATTAIINSRQPYDTDTYRPITS